ncbi:unnamed protein product, partial [Polarella glacialis]
VPGEQLSELLALLQGAQASEPPLEVLVVVTRGSQEPSGDSFHAASAALWGLARSARWEMPRTAVKLVDLGSEMSPEESAAAVHRALVSDELEVAYLAGGYSVPRLVISTGSA